MDGLVRAGSASGQGQHVLKVLLNPYACCSLSLRLRLQHANAQGPLLSATLQDLGPDVGFIGSGLTGPLNSATRTC